MAANASGHWEENEWGKAWIPDGISGQEVNVTVFNPGQESYAVAFSRDGFETSVKNSGQIVVVTKYSADKDGHGYKPDHMASFSETIYDWAKSKVNSSGGTLGTVNTVGSSAGGRWSLTELSHFSAHGEEGVCLVLGDATIGNGGDASATGPNWSTQLSQQDLSNLNGKTIYCFEAKGSGNYTYVNMLKNAGANVILVQCVDGAHNSLTEKPVKTGLFNLIDGNPEAFLNDSNYSFYKRIDGTTEWVEMSDEEVVAAASSKTAWQALSSKYDNLSDFADHYKNTDETLLVSNLCAVESWADQSRSIITSYDGKLSGYTKEGNTAAIIGGFNAGSDYILSVSNMVNGSLSSEVDAVSSIANLIYQMDVKGSDVAAQTISDAALSKIASSYKSAVGSLAGQLKTSLTGATDSNIARMSIGSAVTKGNVGKVSASDIARTAKSVLTALESDKSNATSLKNQMNGLSAMIGTTLKGSTWEAVKANADTYANLMTLRENAAQTLSDSTKAAMQLILNYMDGRDSIDDAEIAVNKQIIVESKQIIEEMKTNIAETKEVCESYYDIWSREYKQRCHTEPYYSESDRAEFQAVIDAATNEIEIAEKEIAYLEGFADIVNQAQQMINDAIVAVNSAYVNAANAIENNSSFATNITLDTSDYDNYQSLISDFNNNYAGLLEKYGLNEKQEETPTSTDPAGASGGNGGSNGNGGSGGGGGGSGGGGGGGGGGSTSTTTPGTTAPSTTTPETTAPGTTAPSTTTPETTAPDTTAPDTTAPDTTVPSETEPSTTVPSETNPQSNGSGGGGGSSRRPYTETKDDANIEETPVEDTLPQEFEPPKDMEEEKYYETPLFEPENEITETQIITEEEVKKSNSGLKTLGIASGIGLAVGAAALGAHAIMKAEEDEDSDEEDYDYE